MEIIDKYPTFDAIERAIPHVPARITPDQIPYLVDVLRFQAGMRQDLIQAIQDGARDAFIGTIEEHQTALESIAGILQQLKHSERSL